MAREGGGIPLRARWDRLDARRRRNMVAATVIGAVVLAVLVAGVSGRNEPTQRLLVAAPTSSRPATTRAATSPSPNGATPSDPAASSDGSTTTGPTGTDASTGRTGGGTGTGGAGTGGTAGSVSPAEGARNSGILGGLTAEESGAGAGGRGPGGATGGRGTTESTTTTTSAPAPADGRTVNVDGDDNGRTITLAVGDTLVVELDPVTGSGWSEPVSEPGVLARTSVDRSGETLTARFTAVQAGTAEVTAVGTPTCTTATPPCLSPVDTYRVTVEVTA